jgi:hypothetical protein
MEKGKLLLTLAGIIMTAAGLALVNFGKPVSKTDAADNYSVTWQADKILTAEAVVGTTPTGKAGIGVWQWSVDGTIRGQHFTETWSGPSISGVSFTPNSSQGCSINGVNRTQILAGCFQDQNDIGGSNTNLYRFSLDNVDSWTSNTSRLNVGTGTQQAVTCINSPRNSSETECLVASGSYAFQHTHEPGFPTRDRWLGAGVLMPLRWTVTGTLD